MGPHLFKGPALWVGGGLFITCQRCLWGPSFFLACLNLAQPPGPRLLLVDTGTHTRPQPHGKGSLEVGDSSDAQVFCLAVFLKFAGIGGFELSPLKSLQKSMSLARFPIHSISSQRSAPPLVAALRFSYQPSLRRALMKWGGPESAPFPLPKSEPPFPPAPLYLL